jgi:hypothetical protein
MRVKKNHKKRIYTKSEDDVIKSGQFTRVELIKMFKTTAHKFDVHVRELRNSGFVIKYATNRGRLPPDEQERRKKDNIKLPIRVSDFLKPLTRERLMSGR